MTREELAVEILRNCSNAEEYWNEMGLISQTCEKYAISKGWISHPVRFEDLVEPPSVKLNDVDFSKITIPEDTTNIIALKKYSGIMLFCFKDDTYYVALSHNVVDYFKRAIKSENLGKVYVAFYENDVDLRLIKNQFKITLIENGYTMRQKKPFD